MGEAYTLLSTALYNPGLICIDTIDAIFNTYEFYPLWRQAAQRVLELYVAANAEPRKWLLEGSPDDLVTLDAMEGREDRLSWHVDRVASLLSAALHSDEIAALHNQNDEDLITLQVEAQFPD